MRSPVLPVRYFLLLFLILVGMMGALILADFLTTNSLAPHVTISIETPFSNTIIEKIFDSLCIAILVLILYTLGIYLIVRKIPEEVSRFTAVRIFSIILVALGILLFMLEWAGDPAQIILIVGILWGAVVVALRDVIQNMVGSLLVLVSRMYRIGDRIEIRGMYGVVMDIGAFRTTMMQLDGESGDHPSGRITTIPNGILFREMITATSREMSFTGDEIRITLPFSADIQKVRTLLVDIIQNHTREIQEQAAREIERLSDRKYLPEFGTAPMVFIHVDRHQILMVVKYYTGTDNRSDIRNRIVEDISRLIPDILDVER